MFPFTVAMFNAYIHSAAGKFVNPLEFSTFLHKYDFRTSPESRPRTQSNKWDKNISLSFIYSGKLSNIAYLWVANVCESLGLAVNFKGEIRVHLCRGVFSQCNDYQIRDLFYSKNRDLSKSMFVELNCVMNKGDYWGPRKKSGCCSSG